MSNNEWMDRAVCLTVDPEVMQPERATKAEVARALALCGPCPVWRQCRDLAKSQQSSHGIAGAYGVHAGEWWGPDPAWVSAGPELVDRECERVGCDRVFRTTPEGRHSARFCGGPCRSAAYRERQKSA